jgi:hypothetical protein
MYHYNITMLLENISHYGDILAIPFFALLVIYFHKITRKSLLEYILFLFSIAGLVLDIVYTYIFIRRVS